VHTITLYLNPQNQKEYYDYILSLQPRRIIFNPGTENDELEKQAQKAGIETVEGCTLVMLGRGISKLPSLCIIKYSGRMLSLAHSDAYELVKEGDGFELQKRRLDDLVSE
jgi:hypothetical protein